MNRHSAVVSGLALAVLASGAAAAQQAPEPKPESRDSSRAAVRLSIAQAPDGQSVRWRNNRLGFSAVSMTPELRRHYGAPEDRGTLITKVEADSPAGKLGLKVGDVVVAVDGERIAEPAELELRLSLGRSRSALEVETVRGGKSVALRQEPLEVRPFGAPRALDDQERETLIRGLQAEILRLEARTRSLKERIRSLESQKEPARKP